MIDGAEARITPTHCPYCAMQCGMSLIEQNGRWSVEARDFPTNRGGLCRKGWTAAELLDAPDRLRTPLMPVLLSVEMLMIDRNLQPKAVEALEMIRRNIKLESQFIDELLDMTRISRDKFDLSRQPMDLHQAARLAAEVVMPDINKNGQRLIIALDAKAHELSGDLKLLQQVFWNLLKNASKFTPEGGEITIRSGNVSVASDNPDRIVVEVSDSGIGFDAEAAERIFEPFIQANESITQRFGGLGLGLAISKAIVDAHGGTIRGISLGPGKGATFIVSLPLS